MIANKPKPHYLIVLILSVCFFVLFGYTLDQQKTPLLLAKFASSFKPQETSSIITNNNLYQDENKISLNLEVTEKNNNTFNNQIVSQAQQMKAQIIEEIKNSKITPEPFKASDQNLPPVLLEIPTQKPVIFLGIDDGQVLNKEAKDFLIAKKWPVTLFINKKHYDVDKSYFKSILDAGANLGNHTSNHPNLVKYTYEQQKNEICGSTKDYQADFGITPKLFRPPYGNFNNNTKQAVKDCGMTALINWKARIEGGKIYYQQGDKLNKGEIVLMHFVPSVLEDLKAFDTEITKQGLEVGNLNEWVV